MIAGGPRWRLEFLLAAFEVMTDAVRVNDGRLALTALVRVVQVYPQDVDEFLRTVVVAKVLTPEQAVGLRRAASSALQPAGGTR